MKNVVNHLPKHILWVILITLSTTTQSQEPKLATDFSLKSFDSKTVQLSNYRGKIVYLDFWASWCKPCIQSFPALNRLRNQYHSQGFEVIAINLDQRFEKAKTFANNNPVDYLLLYDPNAEVAKKYQVQAMPSGFFIDKSGNIRLVHKGFQPPDEAKIEQAIQFLLAE